MLKIVLFLCFCFTSAWNLRVVVLGYDRPKCLYYCLKALELADYNNHRISLDVYIDGPPSTIASYLIAKTFHWRHGPKKVFLRSKNMGVFQQWLNAWNPDWNSTEVVLIVEDDVLVSPIYYQLLLQVFPILSSHSAIYGIALQRAQWQLGMVEKLTWRRLDLVNESYPSLFAYPAVGTWGQLFFPRAWLSFRHWLNYTRKKNRKLIWDGLIHEKWRMERKGDLWSYWFTRYALETQTFNLYFNLPNTTALAISTRAQGKYQKQSLGPSHRLFTNNNLSLILTKVYFFDGCFEPVAKNCKVSILPKYPQIHCHYKPGRYPH